MAGEVFSQEDISPDNFEREYWSLNFEVRENYDPSVENREAIPEGGGTRATYTFEGTSSIDHIAIGRYYYFSSPTSYAIVCYETGGVVDFNLYYMDWEGITHLHVYAKEGNDTVEVKNSGGLVYCGASNYRIGVWDFPDGRLHIDGGPGEDTLKGSNYIDRIYGCRGGDTIYGYDNLSGTYEFLYGDSCEDGDYPYDPDYDGYDKIHGGKGKDYIYGQGWYDDLWGDEGDDYISASSGRNFVNGGFDDDRIYGGDDYELLYGGFGNDTIYGYGDTDIMSGCNGSDVVYGMEGSDQINEKYCREYWGGPETPQNYDGDDDLYGLGYGYSEYNGCDVIKGWLGMDQIHTRFPFLECTNAETGGYQENFAEGGPGRDAVNAWINRDTFSLTTCIGVDPNDPDYLSQSGNDVIHGDEEGSTMGDGDVLCGTSHCDKIYGELGDDLIYLTSCDGEGENEDDGCITVQYAYGGDGDDEIYGSTGTDHMWGDDGVFDYMDGLEGDDKLCSGCGGAEMRGGSGTDVLIIYNSTDPPGEGGGWAQGDAGDWDVVCFKGEDDEGMVSLSGNPGDNDCCTCGGYGYPPCQMTGCDFTCPPEYCDPQGFDCTCEL